MSETVKSIRVFNALSTAAGATSGSSAPIDLNVLGSVGYFTGIATVTGTGTATIGYEVSYDDGTTWFKPSSQAAISTAKTIFTGLTASAGPDSDGKYAAQLTSIAPNSLIRFYITETGSSNAVVVTFDFLVQGE